jgi:hypothetical protein
VSAGERETKEEKKEDYGYHTRTISNSIGNRITTHTVRAGIGAALETVKIIKKTDI